MGLSWGAPSRERRLFQLLQEVPAHHAQALLQKAVVARMASSLRSVSFRASGERFRQMCPVIAQGMPTEASTFSRLSRYRTRNSGRNYLMLEATDAKVYFVQYTREMEEARGRGELRTNSFVRLRKLTAARPLMDVIDLGDAERLLRTRFNSAKSRGIVLNAVLRLLKKAGAAGSDDIRRRSARPFEK